MIATAPDIDVAPAEQPVSPNPARYTAVHILEAAFPVSGDGHTREEKRRAVRRVMLEGWGLRKAGREVGVGNATVSRWVRETEERIQFVREFMAAERRS